MTNNNNNVNWYQVTANKYDVLNGRNFFDNKGNLDKGLMPNYANRSLTTSDAVVNGGYLDIPFSESGYVDNAYVQVDLHTFGEATPEQVLKGYTFTSSSGLNLTGTYDPAESGNWLPVTATSENVYPGSKFYDNTGSLVSGSMPEYEFGEYFPMYHSGHNDTHIQATMNFIGHVSEPVLSFDMSGIYVGNATPADVVKGKTFTTDNGIRLVGERNTTDEIDFNLITAFPEHILSGYTYINQNMEFQGGSMLDFTDSEVHPASYSSDLLDADNPNVQMYLSDIGYICNSYANLNTADFGNALTDQVMAGATFSANGFFNSIGTMPTHKDRITATEPISSGSSILARIPYSGYCDNTSLSMPKSSFGDATQDDVMDGKTFTSSSGLKVTGRYVPPEPGTDVSDTTATKATVLAGYVFHLASGAPALGEYVPPKVETNVYDTTATPADVVSPKVFYNAAGVRCTGQIQSRKSQGFSVTPYLSGSDVIMQIPSLGVYDTTSYVYTPLTSFGDAKQSDVRGGKTFTSTAGVKKSGSWDPWSGTTATAADVNSSKYFYTASGVLTKGTQAPSGIYISSWSISSWSQFGAQSAAGSSGSHRCSSGLTLDITGHKTLTLGGISGCSMTVSGGGKSAKGIGAGTTDVTGYTTLTVSQSYSGGPWYNSDSWGGGSFSCGASFSDLKIV